MKKFLCTTSLWILLLPITIFGLGVASNQAVLIANHDTFPVLINQHKIDERNTEIAAAIAAGAADVPLPIGKDGMIDDVHCVMTNQTHLNALADVFDIGSIYSVGDFLWYLGKWLAGFCPFIWGFAVIDKLRKTV